MDTSTALSSVEFAQEFARASGKCVLYLEFPSYSSDYDWPGEVLQATPYLDISLHGQMLVDGQGFIVCDSMEEVEALFAQTVGDDGPTEQNTYAGPARVYALTINSDGQLQNENT